MSEEGRLPAFVSVKFTPAGRTVSFLLPDLMADVSVGETMVVAVASWTRPRSSQRAN